MDVKKFGYVLLWHCYSTLELCISMRIQSVPIGKSMSVYMSLVFEWLLRCSLL